MRGLDRLTASERQVLKEAAAGMTAPDGARTRGVSVETIRTQRSSILKKLDARNMTQAVAIAAAGTKRPAPPEREQLTEGQLRAFHAKANALDRLLSRDAGASKRFALGAASTEFGRQITSANDLSAREASWTIDRLEAELNPA